VRRNVLRTDLNTGHPSVNGAVHGTWERRAHSLLGAGPHRWERSHLGPEEAVHARLRAHGSESGKRKSPEGHGPRTPTRPSPGSSATIHIKPAPGLGCQGACTCSTPECFRPGPSPRGHRRCPKGRHHHVPPMSSVLLNRRAFVDRSVFRRWSSIRACAAIARGVGHALRSVSQGSSH
jgi:hypothetical protein